jgi:lipid II:glycine glycyltransferase (peptidoglycan interpeptide bridge formation enzyme)
LNIAAWEEFLRGCPEVHLLQTAAWGRLKARFGWEAHPVASGGVGALILFRQVIPGVTIAYIPRGPAARPGVEPWRAADFWQEVDAVCRRFGAVFVKLEADTVTPLPPPPGWRSSAQTIQPPRTLIVDLTGDEAGILARMKQKTRYNLRLAEKKGVVVSPSADLNAYQALAERTARRDGFSVHSREYYAAAFELFAAQSACTLLMASYQDKLLAGLLAFAWGRRAWYLYGASSDEHRDLMAPYLLQWEAMRWARAKGCTEYDLWGVPDADLETLEAQFTARADGLWGVYRFKRGFGGELRRAPGAWDRVYNPVLYAAYSWWARRRGFVDGGG